MHAARKKQANDAEVDNSTATPRNESSTAISRGSSGIDSAQCSEDGPSASSQCGETEMAGIDGRPTQQKQKGTTKKVEALWTKLLRRKWHLGKKKPRPAAGKPLLALGIQHGLIKIAALQRSCVEMQHVSARAYCKAAICSQKLVRTSRINLICEEPSPRPRQARFDMLLNR